MRDENSIYLDIQLLMEYAEGYQTITVARDAKLQDTRRQDTL